MGNVFDGWVKIKVLALPQVRQRVTSDHIISLDVIHITLPITIRKRFPRHLAFPSDKLFLIELFSHEWLAVLNGYDPIIGFSEEFLFLFLAEAVWAHFTLRRIKRNSLVGIAVEIASENQLFRVRYTIQFGKNRVEVSRVNLIWLIELLLVFHSALVDG